MSLLSASERTFLLEGCRDDCRVDGRKRTDLRSFTVLINNAQQQSTSPIILSNGSARLLLDDEHVLLCSVQAQVVTPVLEAPEAGIIELFVNSKNQAAAMQAQAVLRRLLLPSVEQQLDLCLVPHHYVWRLQIDVSLLESSFSCSSILVDAASHVLTAALQATVLPKIVVATATPPGANTSPTLHQVVVLPRSDTETTDRDATNNPPIELWVDTDLASAQPLLSLRSKPCAWTNLPPLPIVVTVSLLKCPPSSKLQRDGSVVLVVDATAEEEACAQAKVHVAVRVHNQERAELCGVETSTGAGATCLPLQLLPEITALAVSTATQAVPKAYRFVEVPSVTTATTTNSALLFPEPLALVLR